MGHPLPRGEGSASDFGAAHPAPSADGLKKAPSPDTLSPRERAVLPISAPLTRPATAGESAVAGHPLPRGEGSASDFGAAHPAPSADGLVKAPSRDTLSPRERAVLPISAPLTRLRRLTGWRKRRRRIPSPLGLRMSYLAGRRDELGNYPSPLGLRMSYLAGHRDELGNYPSPKGRGLSFRLGHPQSPAENDRKD